MFCESTFCIQGGEAQVEHEQEVKGLEAEIEGLGKNGEMSSVLIKDMQKQINEYAHSTSDLEVLHSAPYAYLTFHQRAFCHVLQQMCQPESRTGCSRHAAQLAMAPAELLHGASRSFVWHISMLAAAVRPELTRLRKASASPEVDKQEIRAWQSPS